MNKVKNVFKIFWLFIKKHIWIIIAIFLIIIAIILSILSNDFKDSQIRNLLQNFSLGLIASSIVSLFIELKNYWQIYYKKRELKSRILYELKEETLVLYSKCFKIFKKFANQYKYELPQKNIFSKKNFLKYSLIYEKISIDVNNNINSKKSNYNKLTNYLKISKLEIESLCEILNKLNLLYYMSTIDKDIYDTFKISYNYSLVLSKFNFDNNINLKQKHKNFIYVLLLCSSTIMALLKINFLTEDEILDAENI